MPRQRRRSRRGLQGKLAKQAEGSKFLRLLLGSIWFRLAILGVFLVFVALGLLVVPFFVTSPEGVNPVYRVSGLNQIQAWQLRRRAVALVDNSEFSDADYYWRAALQKNPGDTELSRLALENAMKVEEKDSDLLRASLGYANHYLNMAKTNAVSLDLVCQFYEDQNLMPMLVQLLEPRESALNDYQQRALLKAYFKLRNFSSYEAFRQKIDLFAAGDRELQLYDAAYEAGWGSVETRGAALRRLQEAAETEELGVEATRLLLSVYGQNQEVDAYGELLAKLEKKGEDHHYHHAAYWVLLVGSGRPNVARHQAEDYWETLVQNPVSSGLELAIVAKAYNHVDLPDRALDLFKTFEDQFANSPEFRLGYGTVLVSLKRWEALGALALKIRNEYFSSREMRAYSYYLEGLAHAGQGQAFNAGRSFADVVNSEAKLSPSQAIEMAWEVYDLGYPEIAQKLIVPYSSRLETNLKYWEIVFAGAYKLKRVDMISDAAQRMMDLDPNNMVSINNYAAALLVRRERPEEAIRHTLRLYNRQPNVAGFILNHALALLQNGRDEEAQSLLSRLNQGALRPELVTSMGLAKFELYYHARDTEGARTALLDVDEDHMFPEQLDWLKKTKVELGLIEPEVVPVDENLDPAVKTIVKPLSTSQDDELGSGEANRPGA